MPELPEVETLKRELTRVLIGEQIKAVTVSWPKTVSPLSPKKFSERLLGQSIEHVDRRAKILIFKLSTGEFLLIHLKMTGQLIFYPTQGQSVMGGHPTPPAGGQTKHTRAKFDFTDGSRLHFNDLRKFGWLKLLPANEAEKIFDRHGPEPLGRDFSSETLKQIIKRYPKRRVKQILLDQSIIAGLGNIYVDEACFLSAILPGRIASTLTDREIIKLHQSIIDVLKLSIAKKGTSARNYRRSNGGKGGMVAHLKVYGRQNQPCTRCKKGIIQKIKLNGRGTHFCNQCQK